MRNYAAFCLLLFIAVQGNQFQKIQDQETGEWIPKEEYITSLNEDALLNYRDGWAVGDTDVILAKSPDSFTFTWLPANNTVGYPQIMGNIKKMTPPEILMLDNIMNELN